MKDKNFINAFKKINVSNNLERNILNMTVNKEVKKRKFKLAYLAIIAVLITGFSLSFVYAKEIKGLIKDWSLKIGLGDEEGTVVDSKNKFGNKIVPDDIKIQETQNIVDGHYVIVEEPEEPEKMTFREVENMLGFNILNLEQYFDKEVDYDTFSYDAKTKKYGKPKRVYIGIDMNDYVDKNCKYISEENSYDCSYIDLTAKILTQYADERDFKTVEEEIACEGDKILEETYHSKNLDVDVTFYTKGYDSNLQTAIFTYDNIVYSLHSNRVTREKLIEIIENLK